MYNTVIFLYILLIQYISYQYLYNIHHSTLNPYRETTTITVQPQFILPTRYLLPWCRAQPTAHTLLLHALLRHSAGGTQSETVHA